MLYDLHHGTGRKGSVETLQSRAAMQPPRSHRVLLRRLGGFRNQQILAFCPKGEQCRESIESSSIPNKTVMKRLTLIIMTIATLFAQQAHAQYYSVNIDAKTVAAMVAAYGTGTVAEAYYDCLLYTSPSPRDRG